MLIHIPDTHTSTETRLCIRSQWRQTKGQQSVMILPLSNRQHFLSLINVSWYLRSIPIAPRSHMNNKSEQETDPCGKGVETIQ